MNVDMAVDWAVDLVVWMLTWQAHGTTRRCSIVMWQRTVHVDRVVDCVVTGPYGPTTG
jgi:hypothetical protein